MLCWRTKIHCQYVQLNMLILLVFFSVTIASENTACLCHLTDLLSPLGIKVRQREAKETISHHALWGELYKKDEANVKIVKSYDFQSTSALMGGSEVCRMYAGSPGCPPCAASNWSPCFPLPPPVSATCQLWEANPPPHKAEPVRVSLPFLPTSLHTNLESLPYARSPVAWPGYLSPIPHCSFLFVTISISQRCAPPALSVFSILCVHSHASLSLLPHGTTCLNNHSLNNLPFSSNSLTKSSLTPGIYTSVQ